MDDTTNKDVGITTIELDGKEYRLKFSHIAIATLREDCDIPLLDLLNRIATKVDYDDAILIVWVSLKHHGEFEKMTLSDFKKLLDKNDEKIKWYDLPNVARSCMQNDLPAGEKSKSPKKKRKRI